MTTPDPARAQAARELDRAIAERLGWHVVQRGKEYFWCNGDRTWTAPTIVNEWPDLLWDYLYLQGDIFNYTENIDLALGLVSDLINDFRLERTTDGWEAGIAILANDKPLFTATADTPALAICLAWVKYMQLDPAPRAADADDRRSGGE